ncbi:MAG TPA: FkbM family methyltransferase [Deltaproteobacteria bacterium]|nr:FkbM family methyltransferase [Deltaproteobacteria bacterium]
MLNILYSMYRKLFSRKVFFKLNKLIYNCSIRGLGIYNYENMDVSGERHFIENYIQKIAKDKTIFVFDVGANQGEYTKVLVHGIKNIKVFSFEPHPITYKKLCESCSGLKDVKLFNCALADKKDALQLYDYQSKDGSGHASLDSESFLTVHKADIIFHKVEVSTVDLICEENSVDEIDFLKIDVEGFELEVLKGASNKIKSDKIRLIQFEFTQLNTTRKVFFKDFWELLKDKYNIYRLLPNDLLEIKTYDPTMCEIFGYQNYIAIHRNLEAAISNMD